MIILALETCTPSGGMALLEQGPDGTGRLLAAHTINSGRAQSRLLGVSIQQALRELDLRIADIDVVAVTHGPGSFTGVRVGLSLAKGLCAAPGGPRLVTVSSLAALAHNAFGGERVDAVVALHDALRGEVYARVCAVNNRCLSADGDKDECLSIGDLMERLPRRVLVAGEGAFVHRQLLVDRLGEDLVWARADRALPDPRAVAQLGGMFASNQQWTDPLSARPIYLREATVKVKER